MAAALWQGIPDGMSAVHFRPACTAAEYLRQANAAATAAAAGGAGVAGAGGIGAGLAPSAGGTGSWAEGGSESAASTGDKG